MKRINRLFIILLVFLLCGCQIDINNISVEITNGNQIDLMVGESEQLIVKTNETTNKASWQSSNQCVEVSDTGLVTAKKKGSAVVTVSIDGYSDAIQINVTEKNGDSENLPTKITISVDKDNIAINDFSIISYEVEPIEANTDIKYEIIFGEENGKIVGNKVYALTEESFIIVGRIGNVESNRIIINDDEINNDPYIGISSEQFYSNYEPATSYMDSYYRSLHGFMSGSIEEQKQEPTVSSYQPKVGDLFVRNTSSIYSDDKNTYYIVDSKGKIVNQIYKGGGYVTLEEVAAYVLAFGDIPANYIAKKSGNPQTNEWNKYLRLNHSYFSGDVNKYPYEPVLPNIRGCGGDLFYYEIDLGTTGTDCDPEYKAVPYNNGTKITRGAARIVYTRYDKNEDNIVDVNEKYVFYTYNHYNDFQEYLNYEGGWGEIFGNITGGGQISSKYDYNPTPYPQTIRRNLEDDYYNTEIYWYYDKSGRQAI